MRHLKTFLVLSLLVCAAWAQESDDSLNTSDSFESAVSEPEAAADSEPAAVPVPVPVPVVPAPKKAADLTLPDVKLIIYTADGKRAAIREGSNLLQHDTLSTGQSVEVTFTPRSGGSPFKPQQAMLMAASKAHPGLAAYAVAKAKKDGLHTATLSTAAIEKQIANVGGEVELSLLLGDPSVAVGVSSVLGSVVLPEAASGAGPKPKLLSASHQPLSNSLPNIAHTFRPPAKRGPAVVSLAFTGLSLLPLLALVAYLGYLGVNTKGLPSGASTLWVLLFHGGIAAMLGLYLLFWLQLNLAQTLPVALGLGLFTAGTGYKALSALSDERIAAEKGSSPAVVAKKTN